MNPFFRKLRWLAQRRDKNDEQCEELMFHLEEEAEERLERGLTEAEAQRAARWKLENVSRVEEAGGAQWGWARLERVVRDVGYGLRMIRSNPAFSAIAIATLALGIGGIKAIFSVVYAVLVRPLPFIDADRLVMIWDDIPTKLAYAWPWVRLRIGYCSPLADAAWR